MPTDGSSSKVLNSSDEKSTQPRKFLKFSPVKRWSEVELKLKKTLSRVLLKFKITVILELLDYDNYNNKV